MQLSSTRLVLFSHDIVMRSLRSNLLRRLRGRIFQAERLLVLPQAVARWTHRAMMTGL